MQRLLGNALGALVCGVMLLSPARPVVAGLFDWCCCKKQECPCPECEKQRKDRCCCCCCLCKLPPRAEVAFAIPGVVREESAVRTEFKIQNMEMQAKPKPSAPEAAKADCEDPSVEKRLDALEDDVQKLAELMSRLTNVIDKQNEKQNAKP